MNKISDIKVSYVCNNDCIHCVIADNKESLLEAHRSIHRSTEECKEEIMEAVSGGAKELVLTGGEPTLRKDFLDILEFIREQSLCVVLQTNGRAFHDAEFAQKAADYPIGLYSIALHAPNAELHDKITKKTNSFNETVTGIKNLVELNRFVQVKFVISKLNYRYIKDTIQFIDQLGVRSINITFPHAIGNAGKYFAQVVPTYTDVLEHVHAALTLCREKNIVVQTEAFPYCLMEGFEECVSEHFIASSDIETRPIGTDTINWSERRLEIKQKGDQCAGCLYSQICEGPWEEYVEFFGADELKPVQINPQNMMEVLTKYKKIREFQSGKLEQTNSNQCVKGN